MRCGEWFLSLVLCWGVVAPALAAAGSKDADGKDKVAAAILVSVARLVRVKDKPGADVLEGKAGQALPEGARVFTLEDSRCEIKFGDGRHLRLSSSSTITIARLPRKRAGWTFVHLLRGRIRALINRARGEGDFGVYAVTTLTAVKGTDFDMIRKENDEVTVAVNEGRVRVAELESEDLDAVEKIFLSVLMGNFGASLWEGKMMNFVPGQPFPSPVPMPKGFPNIWGGAGKDKGKKGGPQMPGFPGLGGGGIGFP